MIGNKKQLKWLSNKKSKLLIQMILLSSFLSKELLLSINKFMLEEIWSLATSKIRSTSIGYLGGFIDGVLHEK